MGRKRIFIAVACCAAVLAFAAVSRAQRAPAPEDDIATALESMKTRINDLQTRISDLQARQEQGQGENEQKLNQILQNQEKILRELDVLKVRISIRS